jgi:hypothetical protein
MTDGNITGGDLFTKLSHINLSMETSSSNSELCNMSLSQPSKLGEDPSKKKRHRTKSLENLHRSLNTPKMQKITRSHLNVAESAGASPIADLSPRCTNRQILNAISSLSDQLNTRMDTIELRVTDRIDKLESTLETKLLSKLNPSIEAKVQEAVAEANTGLSAKLGDTVSRITNLEQHKELINAELQQLKEENQQITESLMNHQKYLEGLEARKRAGNIIITGLPEGDINIGGMTYNSDEDKVEKLLDEIGQPLVMVGECIRLGQVNTTNTRPRILKVTLRNAEDRKGILQNTNQLKEKEPPLNTIYIKKDVHPAVRKELGRLRQVVKDEKKRAENEGRTVSYDAANRCVKVDETVIDKFRSSLF